MELMSKTEIVNLDELWKMECSYLNKFMNVSLPLGGLTKDDVTNLYLMVACDYYDTHHNTSNIKIAEVGCWTGLSSLVLALSAKKFNGTVISIDWFKGSENTNLDWAGDYFNVKKIFMNNISKFTFGNCITPMEATSIQASEKFTNESLDVIFLDADHRYKNIKKDIDIWLPKLKKGGLLCGHDCEIILDKGIDTLYDITKDMDIIEVVHMGVCRAVTELGGKKVDSLENHTIKESISSGLWYYVKPLEENKLKIEEDEKLDTNDKRIL